jgi:NAD(P)-dependent dehydrogenase (short-subunit alcohol dehydrogenase family)
MGGLIDGKSVLITGAGSGIGRASALACGREGGLVTAADRDLASAEATAAAIRAAGGVAMAIRAEVADEGDVEAMVAAAVSKFGSLHAAFNNAGVARTPNWVPGTSIADTDLVDWNELMSINLTGVYLSLKHEVRHMRDNGGGIIVNTASVAGMVGLKGAAMYTASKHGVVGLTKAAALEFADAGIRVNAVCPGYVKTAITAQTEVRHTPGNDRLSRVPMKRMGAPEEIAEMVVWLCSDRSSYATGACFTVDGGWMA